MADIDFENYTLETERVTEIRSTLSRLREQEWVPHLLQLVAEKGELEASDAVAGLIPGLIHDKEADARVYRPQTGHAAEGLLLSLSGKELKMRFWDIPLLDVSFLPKGNDFAVLFLNEGYWDFLLSLVEALEEDFTAARKLKADRQAQWKARFAEAEVPASAEANPAESP